MQLKHFHLAVALLLGIAAIHLAVNNLWLGAGLMCVGAIVAALHWKAAKSGLID